MTPDTRDQQANLRERILADERLVRMAEANGSQAGRDAALRHMAETLGEIFGLLGFKPHEYEAVFNVLRNSPELRPPDPAPPTGDSR